MTFRGEFKCPFMVKTLFWGISARTRGALFGSWFFQSLCQLECVLIDWSVWSVLAFCWKPKLFQSHRQSHSRWMGSRVEESRGVWVGGLQRAQCLSSSRSSTLKKRLINGSLIGWRGHTHPFSDALTSQQDTGWKESEEKNVIRFLKLKQNAEKTLKASSYCSIRDINSQQNLILISILYKTNLMW